ncbi:hypothetical protein [Pollutibacter soli]|uniref:hypothetical protein n=1 Tax=Pollutibacter soli TaxID=3034157 RepID=UPI00301324EB
MSGELKIISSEEIDKKRWNDCIIKSSNGLIYARAEYLDHMCENWSGIVQNEYEAVMPVPWKKKLNIIYTPSVPFIQQLGIFSQYGKYDEEKFLDALSRFSSYGDYFFNYKNQVQGSVSQTNFVLKLDRDIETLLNSFTNDAVQNIKKGAGRDLQFSNAKIRDAIAAFRNLYGKRFTHVSKEHYQKFEALCLVLEKEKKAFARKIETSAGEMQSIVLLLKDERRLYNIMNSTTDEGRHNAANHFLLYNIWGEFHQSNLLFDFEGSDVPGVKSFYEKFNPVNEPFYHLHFNNLPAPIRWLKK